jgi:hypothetical protein
VPKGSQAGGSARAKHKDLTKSWHRRHRGFFFTLGAICGLVVVAAYLASRVWPEASWMLGFFGGVALTFFLLMRWSPPGWIENWEVGALGEEATGRQLAKLDSTRWSVIHDVDTGRGNVDHLVIGPGGVFVLDSKRVGGRVIVRADDIRVERMDDERLGYPLPVANVRGLAAQTSERMFAATHIRAWVTPVLVIWAEFPQRLVEGDWVVVHGEDLVGWLESRPVRVASENIPRIANAARAAWIA